MATDRTTDLLPPEEEITAPREIPQKKATSNADYEAGVDGICVKLKGRVLAVKSAKDR